MEKKPLKNFPNPIILAKSLSEEFDTIAVFEDLSDGGKYCIVAWGSKFYVSGSSIDVVDRLRNAAALAKNIFPVLKAGMIGYVSYDAVRLWEKVRDLKPYPEEWPYVEMFIPRNIVLYSYDEGLVYLYGEDTDFRVRDRVDLTFRTTLYDVSPDRKGFERGVEEVLKYIRDGYAFQVVLSRFARYTYRGNPVVIYEKLRNVNPSPYMYFIKLGDRVVVGASPELLFRVRGRYVETFPIAGTRPRGRDPYEDRVLEAELMNSTKDRAEHLMLVDLARNDLGKICTPRSVMVEKFMYVEKYSYVQHIVSKVVGMLKKRVGFVEIIKALLPAGTVSGAPKPFAINLIEELEEYKRGPYAGAVGYVSSSGDSLFAIAIRSGFIYRDLLRIQAGAGIVYDSVPSLEYEETEHKLKALKVAIGVENA